MAYRFLLEVPDGLADDASVAVNSAGDAQVVVLRSKSHSLTWEDPHVDMTVAAHSLNVVRTIYAWFEGFRDAKPEVGLVLHSGERILLTDHSRVDVAAIIRRDQPWVERTAPKIGDHEDDYFAPAVRKEAPVTESAVVPAPSAKAVLVQAVSHLAIRVADLPRAEAFYTEMLAMDVVAREKRGAAGAGYEPTDSAVSADVSFLRNGPLVIALHANPASARLERSLLDHISIELDGASFHRVKGTALMRGYEIVATGETAAAFRDPFGIVWEIAITGNAPFHATA